MHRLLLLGLNHATAPLAVREKLAFNAQQQQAALAALRARFTEAEFVLLSTCNRVEIYASRAVHGHPRSEELVEFLASFHSLPSTAFSPHLYHKTERGVVEHLFTVACSLDSMVLGETQILGQVRAAYDLAHALPATGAMLNPLFQRAIAVGKEVMTQTTLTEGRLSVASVAVEFSRRIFDRFTDKTILSVGAGKMAALVLSHFAALSPGRLLVCNRTHERAVDLAGQVGGEAAAFAQLGDHLTAADIVVSSTGAAEPIITRAAYEKIFKARRYKPVFMIDIALPRDIEPAVTEIENVYLYNLDDLQQVVSSTQLQRKDSIEAATAIVGRHVEEFIAFQRAREVGPLIDALYRRSHALAQDELAHTMHKLPGISDAEKAHLEDLARRIVNKLLHDPIGDLRHADPAHGPMGQYLHAMERLFRLADTTEPDAEPKQTESTEAKPRERPAS